MKQLFGFLLVLGTVIALGSAGFTLAVEDPCEASGDPLDTENGEEFEIPAAGECCVSEDWEPSLSIIVRLLCMEEETECEIDDIKMNGVSIGTVDPYNNEFSPGFDPENPNTVTVDVEGDCDNCCIILEYKYLCCNQPETICSDNPGCLSGYFIRGRCAPIECDDCPNCPPPPIKKPVDPGYSDPGSDCRTPNSVDLYRGHKHEVETDLRVRMPGRDFVITRTYSSDPNYGSDGLMGPKWTLSPFASLQFDYTDPCAGALFDGAGKKYALPGEFATSCDFTDEIAMQGPVDWFWVKTKLYIDDKDLPVWKLVVPGESERFFIRMNEAGTPDETGSLWHQVNDFTALPFFPEGLLIRSEDVYGNVQEYVYDNDMFGDHVPQVRLKTILLKSFDLDTVASLDFEWITHWNEEIGGNLRSITVVQDEVPTQRVTYDYMDEWKPEEFSSHLGSSGDLVQVVREELLDVGALEDGRQFVTQYRYHGSFGGESYQWQGDRHQLKMVIRSEQIEHLLREATSLSGSFSDRANTLLLRSDDSVAATGSNLRVVDLAAKIIEKYELTGDRRVLVQYLQSDCGCSGGSNQVKKLEYTRTLWSSGSGATTQIDEKISSGGVWTLHKSQLYDVKLLGDAPGQDERDLRVPYVIHHVIDDGAENEWVSRYDYDSNRNRVREFTPAAIESYVAADSLTDPEAEAFENEGLIYHYGYASNNRRTSVEISEGELGTKILQTKTYYGGASRDHLVSKIERYPDESGTNPEVTEFYYSFHTTQPDAIASREVRVLAEGPDENGPDETDPQDPNWYTSFELYDEFGNNIWSMAADGVLTRREFDENGLLILIERNAAGGTELPGSHPLAPFGSEWAGRFADGGSLTITLVRDDLGRIVQRTAPDGVTSYTRREMRDYGDGGLLHYVEVSLPPRVVDDELYAGPAVVQWFTTANQQFARQEFLVNSYTFDSIETDFLSAYSLHDTGDPIAKQEIRRNIAGQVVEREVWTWLGDDLSEVTQYAYDSLGRLDYMISPSGTVTRSTYDIHDRVIKQEIGLADGDVPDSNTMTTVSEYYYDHVMNGSPQQGVGGNGHLTFVRQFTSDSEWRDTILTYDFRGRRTLVENPLPPHQYVVYDNLGRTVKQAVFDGVPDDIDDPSVERGRYVEIDYSRRGLAYRQRVAIDPEDLNAGFLETHTWFDHVGRSVGQWAPNSPMTKTTFDGLGRPVAVYTVPGSLADHDDVYDSEAYEADVEMDIVIEQVEYGYIDAPAPLAGNLDLVTVRRRLHDAGTNPGALGDDDSITTFTGTDYDVAGRPIRSINFGTRHADGFAMIDFGTNQFVPVDAPGSPQVFDTEPEDIITLTRYDERGRVLETEDDEGQITRFMYDDTGRRIATVESFNEGEPGSFEMSWHSGNWYTTGLTLGHDQNRVTTFAYINGNMVKQSAHVPGDDPQVTQYVYGVSDTDSPLASTVSSNELLRKIIYPKSTSSTPEADCTVTFSYNRQGEVTKQLDQNGTERLFTRDKLGRVTKDAVKSFGAGIDDAVGTIETIYDDFGRVDVVSSLASHAGSEEVEEEEEPVVNSVQFTYSPLWQVENVFQEHDGDVDGSTAFVGYTYVTENAGNGNHSRLSETHYPETGKIHYGYGSSGSIDDALGRVRAINEGPLTIIGTPGFANYEYIGAGMTAVVDYPRIDVQLDRTAKANGERNASGYTDDPGLYPGYDRFGRVVRHMWVDGDFQKFVAPGSGHGSQHGDSSKPHIPPIYELTHTYDKASNRLSRYNETATLAWDQSHVDFTYDGLYRLTKADFGTREDEWTLDALGNWTETTGPIGDGDHTKDTRTHSDANELSKRLIDGRDSGDGSGSYNPFHLTYDKNGSLINQQIPEHTDDTEGYVDVSYTYDAWNRLVVVEYDEIERARYDYNGLNWRIAKTGFMSEDYEHSAISFLQRRLMFYSANWQLLEEHIDDDFDDQVGFDANRHLQYIWGTRYIDDIVVRRQDTNLDDTLDKTWYHITDTLFSTVAILDGAANLIERVSYDAYGNARHHRLGDLDGDGATTSADVVAMDLDRPEIYGVGDITRTGIVTSTDESIVLGDFAWALPAGRISSISGGTDNIIGYAGYIFNAEMHGSGLYTVRHRHYSPELGRWTTRDPIGYVDGMGLYEYAKSNAMRYVDTFGLFCDDLCELGEVKSPRVVGMVVRPAIRRSKPSTIDAGVGAVQGARRVQLIADLGGFAKIGASIHNISMRCGRNFPRLQKELHKLLTKELLEIGFEEVISVDIDDLIDDLLGIDAALIDLEGPRVWLKLEWDECVCQRCCIVFFRNNWEMRSDWVLCDAPDPGSQSNWRTIGKAAESCISRVSSLLEGVTCRDKLQCDIDDENKRQRGPVPWSKEGW